MGQCLLRGKNSEVSTVLTLSDDVRLAEVVGEAVLAFTLVLIFYQKFIIFTYSIRIPRYADKSSEMKTL